MPRTTTHDTSQNVLAASLWMVGALISFTLVAISGRGAQAAGVDTMHLMCLRSVFALGVVAIIAPFTAAGFRQIATRRPALHGLRHGLHFIAQYSWFTALGLIPLTQLFAVEFTAPLWVALLAPLFLAERLTPTRIIAAIVGFGGVLVVVRPATMAIGTGTIFALVAALGFAASMVATRALMRTERALSFLFHMSWTQAALAGALLWGRFVMPTPEGLMWISLVGLSGLGAHLSLARAFSHADAIIVAPMDFLRLPLIALVGLVVYQEPLDPVVLTGGVIVVAANLLNMWAERRSALRRSRERHITPAADSPRPEPPVAPGAGTIAGTPRSKPAE